MELNITKEEFLGAEKIIFTKEMITRNGVTGWNLYLLKDGTLKKVTGGYTWDRKKGCHRDTTIGSDRMLHILESIAYQLRTSLHQIKAQILVL